MRYDFQPNFRTIGRVPGVATIEAIDAETGMYSATPEFARLHGGPITRSMLDAVPAYFYDDAKALGFYPNCDVRIHRLYPGTYPAYPGWHCDGEFRETYFAQPDLDKIPLSHHITGFVASSPDVSRTEFLETPVSVEVDAEYDLRDESQQRTLWGQVHEQIESGPYRSRVVEEGDLVLFDARSPHRARATVVRGWRLFFRMSMWHRPNLGDGGKLAKQEQVYVVREGEGW